MKMIGERGYNIHFYPIIKRRGRSFEGNYVKNDFIAEENSRWTLRCYKFMDWLSTKMRQNFEKTMNLKYPDMGIPKSNEQRVHDYCVLLSNPQYIYDLKRSFSNPNNGYYPLAKNYHETLIVDIKQLAKELKGFTKAEVKEVLRTIASCRVITKYQIKRYIIQNNVTSFNYKFEYNNANEGFESLFNIEFNDNETTCKIVFNTGLSICFLHNIYTNGYEIIDDDMYKLSESAQIIYRKRFFQYNGFISKLSLNFVLDTLGIVNKNKTNNNNLFKRIITELSDYNLIDVLSEDDSFIEVRIAKEKKDRTIIDFPLQQSG